MTKFKIVTLSVILAISSYNVVAAGTTSNIPKLNPLAQRNEIIKNTTKNQLSVEIGYSPLSTDKLEMYEWIKGGLVFANNLSNLSNSNIAVIPENNPQILEKLIKAQKYKYLYVTPDLAVLAEEIAYTPIVKNIKDSESVNVVLSSNNTTDLMGKKIGMVTHSVESKVALGNLKSKSIKPEFANSNAVLFQQLDTKVVDAIVLNKFDADELIATSASNNNNKSKYKIVSSNGVILGNILLVSLSVPNDELNTIKQAFLNLKIDNDKDLATFFAGIKEGSIFEEYNKDILKPMRTTLASIDEDYGRAIYAIDSNKYVESNTLFVKVPSKTDAKASTSK